MDNNPYAPPKAAVADVPPGDGESTAASAPLYSTMQMAVASFIGSAMAGAWLAAANFRAVGQPVKARGTLWLGLGVTIVTMAIAYVLPDKFPNSVLPIAIAFGVRAAAEPQFAHILREHQRTGGDLRSWWRVVGIGLLVAACVLAALFLVAFVYTLITGKVPGEG